MSIDDLIAASAGYETIDDLLNSRPYIDRPTRHMLFSVACTVCDYARSEEYARQNPDRLLLDQWCPKCHADIKLTGAIPHTVYHWAHSWKHASFRDNVAGECWHCGRKGELWGYTCSNGDRLEVCPRHFKLYRKQVYRFAGRRAATIEQNRTERAGEIGQWREYDDEW